MDRSAGAHGPSQYGSEVPRSPTYVVWIADSLTFRLVRKDTTACAIDTAEASPWKTL